jgi:hypothetical protein
MATLTLKPLAALITNKALRVVDRRNPRSLGGFTSYAEVRTTDIAVISVDTCAKDDCPLRSHKTSGTGAGQGGAHRSALGPGFAPHQKQERRHGNLQHEVSPFVRR